MPLIPERADGLLGLVAGIKGFAQGMQDMEDRKMKKIEFDARMKAADSERKQKEFDKRLEARKAGFLVPENDQEFDPGQLQYDPKYLEYKKQMAAAMAGAKPSPAQSAADSTFGKDYAEYQAGGGSAAVDKNIGLLESGIADLEAPGELTSSSSSAFPILGSDAAQDVINPNMAAVRDKIRSAIQGTLRQVLGPQFTEKEGQAIFNRAFNPRLSDAENARRARVELAALKEMAEHKEEAARYYEKNGTLRGFKPATNKARGKGILKSDATEQKELQRLEELRRKAAGG